MLSATNNKFDSYLGLKKRVSNDVINEKYIKYFDNDGFELSFLEQEYYRENGINLNYTLNHGTDQKEWIIGGDEHFKIDHSLLLQRWAFVDEAKRQLEYKRKEYPQLNKYLNLVPKWGLDFLLEYYNENTYMEVLHIEMDYRSYGQAVEAKDFFQKKLLETDWIDFAKSLIRKKDEWQFLPGMQQNDYKAALWGLNKAETTQKAFA